MRLSIMIKRNLRMNNTKHKTTAYKTLVRPVMEYGVSAWDTYTKKNINRLEAVQRSAARYILVPLSQCAHFSGLAPFTLEILY